MTHRPRVWGMVLTMMMMPAAAAREARADGGPVALQTADPACPDDSGDIYVDCDNGTVTDNRSGIVWLKNANCFGEVNWSQARDAVSGLGDTGTGIAGFADCDLTDNSSPGEWRLPSVSELYEMFRGTGLSAPNCTPTLTNDPGDACWTDGPSSFTDVQDFYWGSTPNPADPTKISGVYIGVAATVAALLT